MRLSVTDSLRQDLRYSARLLRKAPGFTITAIVVIALGIGANCAIFSLVDVVLFRPLPYANPEQLVRMWEHPPGFARNSVSPLNFSDYREQNQVFASMAGIAGLSPTLTAPNSNPERIAGQAVTEEFFDVLGVKPLAGRTFTAEDVRPEARVVVLSESLWRVRFGGDAGLIGRQITLDGVPRTVVGIVPGTFQALYESNLWTPFRLGRAPSDRRSHYLQVIARLKPGVAIEQARANLETIAEGVAIAHPETNKGWSVTLAGLREAIVGDDLRTTSLMLAGVSALVLLMGCANIAGLLLARGVGRRREIAVRIALGVTPGRMLQQLLTESTLLALIGSAVGIALAWTIVRAAPAFLPAGTLPAALHVSLDARVLAFACLATLLTGLLFGFAPAWQASRLTLADTLRAGGRSSTGGETFRTVLAAAEIAVAVMLVAGAGLLLRTLGSLNAADTGFHAENVLTMRLNNSKTRNSQSGPMLQRIEREIMAIPGLKSVGMGINLPVDGWDIGQSFQAAAEPPLDMSKRPSAHYQIVNNGWFETFGIPVIAGRSFNDRDTARSAPVCMVNEELVRRYFGGASPVGQRLRVQPLSVGLVDMEREIVGVIRQVKVQGLGEKGASLEVYVPMTQDAYSSPMIGIRMAGNPLAALPAVKEAIARVDPDLPLTRVRTMEEVAAQTVTQPRFRARLVSAFAAVALILAAVGIFGVLAFSVSRRTREFGIRMALGARSGDVLALVMRRGIVIAGAGVAGGLLGAIGLTRFLQTLLFGVDPLDPVTFLIAPAVLICVAMAACALPAARAARVNPAVALHSE